MYEPLKLIVTGEDHYQDDSSVFVVNPSRLQNLRAVRNNYFDSCLIENSDVKYFTPAAFLSIFMKLKPNARVDIVVDQPLPIMQDVIAKQFMEAANQAGFETDGRIGKGSYTKQGKDIDSLAVTVTKPEKTRPDIEMGGAEVTTTTVTTTKKTVTKKK